MGGGSAQAAAAACSMVTGCASRFSMVGRARQDSAGGVDRVVKGDENIALDVFEETSKPCSVSRVAHVVEHQVAIAVCKGDFEGRLDVKPAPHPAYSCGVLV